MTLVLSMGFQRLQKKVGKVKATNKCSAKFYSTYCILLLTAILLCVTFNFLCSITFSHVLHVKEIEGIILYILCMIW